MRSSKMWYCGVPKKSVSEKKPSSFLGSVGCQQPLAWCQFNHFLVTSVKHPCIHSFFFECFFLGTFHHKNPSNRPGIAIRSSWCGWRSLAAPRCSSPARWTPRARCASAAIRPSHRDRRHRVRWRRTTPGWRDGAMDFYWRTWDGRDFKGMDWELIS